VSGLQGLRGSPKLWNQFTKENAISKLLKYENCSHEKDEVLKFSVHSATAWSASASLRSSRLTGLALRRGHLLDGTKSTSLWMGLSWRDTGFVLLPLAESWSSPTTRFTFLTSPLLPLWASVTWASCHWLWVVLSSLTRTTCPVCKFLRGRTHFCCSSKAWRNSFLQRVKSSFVSCWRRHHCFLNIYQRPERLLEVVEWSWFSWWGGDLVAGLLLKQMMSCYQ